MSEAYETRILQPEEGIPEVAEALLKGELAAFPTETVYGLGALGTLPDAVRRIFEVKGRPQDNPLILHFANPAAMTPYIKNPGPCFAPLSEALMPGPLTLVVPASTQVPPEVTAGLATVAVRCPSNPAAVALLRSLPEGIPLAAPSANLSGRPSPTLAEDVYEDLQGKIPYIIDGGPCEVGLESTILDLTDPEGLRILRPGYISEDFIAAVLDASDVAYRFAKTAPMNGKTTAPKAPGMKYRHYAPQAAVTILQGEHTNERLAAYRAWRNTAPEPPCAVYGSSSFIRIIRAAGGDAGITAFAPEASGDERLAQAAALFRTFRTADRAGIRALAVEAMSGGPVADAYMNRLRKAADGG